MFVFKYNVQVLRRLPSGLLNFLLIASLFQHVFGGLANCYIKTSTSKVISNNNNICIVKYNTEGCLVGDEYPDLGNVENESIEILEEKNDKFTASLSITFRLLASGSTLLVINGITNSNESRCISVRFLPVHVTPEQPVVLHVERLLLSHGNYNLTGIHTLTEIQTLTEMNSQSLEITFYETRIHKTFDIPMKKRESRRSGAERECICNGCLSSSYQFFNETGLLRFYYNMTNVTCKFTVTLFVYKNPSMELNARTCSILPIDADTLRLLSAKVSREADTVPVDFPNVPRGCYTIKTLKGLFLPFFWLNTINEIDMELWNTTIKLTARNIESSLEVRWSYPEYPFNFTSWRLTLWHLKNSTVYCEGENSQNEWIETIETDEPILTTSHYVFTNLSDGYYCVRLYPSDYRCPRDGCTPRSSRTVLLKKSQMEILKLEKIESPSDLMISLLVIGSGILGGICLGILSYIIYQKNSKNKRFIYNPVGTDHCFQLEPVSVLLIWTRFALKKDADVEPLVNAFKELLRTYAKCKIYDYMDKSSLDKKQRQQLISNPTEWLYSHLKTPNKKIILIETDGAKHRQVSRNEMISCEDSLDEQLFPFVLRYLTESKDLSSDYSRIFLVRFSQLQTSDIDLEGIVPWMRFTIPNHLRNLTLKLRGLSEDLSTEFPLLSREKLQAFESALRHYKNQGNLGTNGIYCPT